MFCDILNTMVYTLNEHLELNVRHQHLQSPDWLQRKIKESKNKREIWQHYLVMPRIIYVSPFLYITEPCVLQIPRAAQTQFVFLGAQIKHFSFYQQI